MGIVLSVSMTFVVIVVIVVVMFLLTMVVVIMIIVVVMFLLIMVVVIVIIMVVMVPRDHVLQTMLLHGNLGVLYHQRLEETLSKHLVLGSIIPFQAMV